MKQLAGIAASADAKARLGEFSQLTRSLLMGGDDAVQALELARQGRAADRVQTVLRAAVLAGGLRGLVEKAAVPAMGTTGDTAALAAFETLAAAFLESLRHESAVAAILADEGFIRVPFRARVAVVSAAATGSSVSELGIKPVTRLSVDAGDPAAILKACVLVVVSNELLRFGPLANTLVTNELRSALAVEFDRIVFATLLADTTIPNAPTSGLTASDAASDLSFLASAVSTSSRSKLYLVGAPDAVKSFALRNSHGLAVYPDLGISGGSIGQTPVLVSDGLDPGTLLLIDAAQIAFSDAGVILDTARHATVRLDDAPEVSSPASSLWQQNQIGLRAERTFAVQAIGPHCLSYVTGIGSST